MHSLYLVAGLSLIGRTLGLSLPVFATGNPWNIDISSAPLDPNSTAITNWLNTTVVSGVSALSWGRLSASAQGNFRIGPDFIYLEANCSTPRVTVKPRTASTTTTYFGSSFSSYYTGDCEDTTGLLFPTPVDGNIEGAYGSVNPCMGWWCPCLAADCHLLVFDTVSRLLYESYQTYVEVSPAGVPIKLHSGCVVIWNTSYVYPSNQRGDGCTSVDAAGFPIAPLLFTPEELQAGVINHALRFVLPNPKMRAAHWVHPGTHYGAPSAPITSMAPIYGSRWRLKANYDISTRPAHAQTILRALKKYGMFLSDGGNIAFTAVADHYQSVKWTDTTLQTNFANSQNGLWGINPGDFEVVAPFGSCTADALSGRAVTATGACVGVGGARPDCVRNGATWTAPPYPCPPPSTSPSTSTSTSSSTSTSTSTSRASTSTSAATTSTSTSSTTTGAGTGTQPTDTASSNTDGTSTQANSNTDATSGTDATTATTGNTDVTSATTANTDTATTATTANTNPATSTSVSSTSPISSASTRSTSGSSLSSGTQSSTASTGQGQASSARRAALF